MTYYSVIRTTEPEADLNAAAADGWTYLAFLGSKPVQPRGGTAQATQYTFLLDRPDTPDGGTAPATESPWPASPRPAA